MPFLDWAIIAGFLAILSFAAWRSSRLTRSVAGFLAAERCGGRYLITVANNAAMVGVISLVWFFEQNYEVGYTTYWWTLMEGPALVVMALTGWVYYRYRQTRVLTLAQFFEVRYSRSFRIVAGWVAFMAGIINFGIFPAVGARFFIAMTGLPMQPDVFAYVMAGLLVISIVFVFLGGQITVMVTDFIQGTFGNIVFAVIIAWLLWTLGWDRIETVVTDVPAGESLTNPFDLEQEQNFNLFYYIIGIVVLFYGPLGWQGTQGYYVAARNAHEAKMANILNGWRPRVLLMITLVVAISAHVVMKHPDFATQRSTVEARQAEFSQAESDPAASKQVAVQVRAPLVLHEILPIGLRGLMIAAMVAAFISTHDSYLHSWGSMLVQDIILPLRKVPLEPDRQLWWLRMSIVGVAIFIFAFSMFVPPTQFIAMFLALTGGIFVSGGGAVIIGGLYWKHGSTAGAWAAMVVGVVGATLGVVALQYPDDVPAFDLIRDFFTGQEWLFFTMWTAATCYVCVSLLVPDREFDLDKMLHRGVHRIEGESTETIADAKTLRQFIGISNEFTRGDIITTLLTIAWPIMFTVIFLAGTAFHLSRGVSDEGWFAYWKIWTIVTFVTSIAVTAWFTIGGLRDLRRMLADLRIARANVGDDGFVNQTDDHASERD